MAEQSDIPSKPVARAVVPIELDTTRADEQIEELGRKLADKIKEAVGAMGEGVPFSAPGGGDANEFRPSVEGQSYDKNHQELMSKMDEIVSGMSEIIGLLQER